MDELIDYLRLYTERLTCKFTILFGHSGQIPAGAISAIVKILLLTVFECHFGGPFSIVFQIRDNYSHVTHFIIFYWSYNIKVVEIGKAASEMK